METAILLCLLAASPLTRTGHPGPFQFTVDDYDGRYQAMLQGSRLAGDPNPAKIAMEKVAQSRMKEYPGKFNLTRKRSLYARELKLIEQQRDQRARDESRRDLENLVKRQNGNP